MSSNDKLNSEMAELESVLRNSELPAVRLDRDELMYQSGWAAALASLNSPDRLAKSTVTSVLPDSTRNPNRWSWPLLAAATSLIAIVMGTMWATQLHSNRELAAKVTSVTSQLKIEPEPNENTKPILAVANVDWANESRTQTPDLLDLIMALPDETMLAPRLTIGFNQTSPRVRQDRQETLKIRTRKKSSVKTRHEMLEELLSKRS